METEERDDNDTISEDGVEEEYHGKTAVIILGNKYDAGNGWALSRAYPREIRIKDYMINDNIIVIITDNDTKIVTSVKNVVIYEYA